MKNESAWDGLGYPSLDTGTGTELFDSQLPAVNAQIPIELSANERSTGGASQAVELVRIAHAHFEFILGDEGRTYAVDSKLPTVAVEVTKEKFGEAISSLYFDASGKVPSGNAITDALRTLRGQVRNETPKAIHLRVAEYQGSIVLDLGTTDGRCVVINAGEWHVTNRSPVLFRRNKLGLEFPEPQKSGSLDALRSLLNVDESGFRLLIGWIISTLKAENPQVILTLTGSQGTAKSTAARFLGRLIDPNEAGLSSQPDSKSDLAVTARAVYVYGLDNVSRMPSWLQDGLCMIATGAAMPTRTKYTDDDLTVFRVKRPIVLTSINPGALQGDIADRMLLVELEPVPEHKRRLESEVVAAFENALPEILGAVFNLAALVLQKLPEVKLDKHLRMADFTNILAALDMVTGWDTVADFRNANESISREVIDSDSFASAVRDMLNNSAVWQGTCADLLAKLEDGKSHPGFPRNGQGVRNKLDRFKPAFAKEGISVTRLHQSNRGRIYKLERLLDESSVQEITAKKTNPTISAKSQESISVCSVCNLPLHKSLISNGETTHPTC